MAGDSDEAARRKSHPGGRLGWAMAANRVDQEQSAREWVKATYEQRQAEQQKRAAPAPQQAAPAREPEPKPERRRLVTFEERHGGGSRTLAEMKAEQARATGEPGEKAQAPEGRRLMRFEDRHPSAPDRAALRREQSGGPASPEKSDRDATQDADRQRKLKTFAERHPGSRDGGREL